MLKLKTNLQQAESTVEKQESKLYFVQKTIGNDTYIVMAQSQVMLEDEFSSLYYTASNQSNLFLMPPFEPNILMNLVQTNNILNQCVDTMEVNIDGTGHTFEPLEEGKKIDPKEEAQAKAFFEEPYPNLSFIKIRRKLRRQMESIGYGFLEILRNVTGDIVGIRNIETNHVRFVKLDAPILVKKKLFRDGKEVEITMWDRERRFAQRVALKQLVYYREFGTTRQVNRNTGRWETPLEPVAPEDQATELLVFGITPDITTPYFVPRWVNDMPSVIGSRKAEEQNLQFLDSGGMPPAIIFVQGGTLAKDMSDQLKMYLSGQNKNKYRAVVIEAQSSSGSLDSAGSVQVKVERFGSQGEKDAMFQKYDENTENHVRQAFRLPPLFLGRTEGHNYATATVSYMIAEAQIFAIERHDFDTTINKTIIRDMGFTTLRLKSIPITLKDIASMLKGFELAKDASTRESYLAEINKATGTNLELAPMPQPDQVMVRNQITGTEATPVADLTQGSSGGAKTVAQTPHEQLPASTKPPAIGTKVIPLPHPKPPVTPGATPAAPAVGKKPKKAVELIELAHEYAASQGLVRKRDMTEDQKLLIREQVGELEGDDVVAFDTLLATYTFGSDDPDLVYIAKMGGGNPNHDEKGRFSSGSSEIFVSPNDLDTPMSFHGALQSIAGDKHVQLHKMATDITTQIDSGGTVHDAVGDTQEYGIEDALVVESNTGDKQKVQYMASLLGDEGEHQKTVIPFVSDTKGADSVWQFSTNKNPAVVSSELNRLGVPFRTLEPKGSGTHVWVFDQGTAMKETMGKVGTFYGVTPKQVKGSGEFLGGDTREEGHTAYTRVIHEYESRGNKPYRRRDGPVFG